MSQIFSVSAAIDELPTISQFVEEISAAWLELTGTDVTVSEAVLLVSPTWNNQEGEEWLEDTSYLFYLTNISTRGLEVWCKDGRFHVRVSSLSCQHEWLLAFDMLAIAGQTDDAVVHTDTPEGVVKLGELRQVFNDEWIAAVIAEHVEKTFAAIAEGIDKLEFGGPLRPFYFGPWVALRLLSVFPNIEEQYEEMIELIFDMMRFVQYFFVRPQFVDFEMADTVTFAVSGSQVRGALLTHDRHIYFPAVEFLVLPHPKQGFLALPAADTKEHLQPILEEIKEVVWLDESQFAVFALDQARLAEIAEQIAPACKKVKLTSV